MTLPPTDFGTSCKMRIVTVPTSEGGWELNEIQWSANHSWWAASSLPTTEKHLKRLERQWHIVVCSHLEVFFLFYCQVLASHVEAGDPPRDQRPALTWKKHGWKCCFRLTGGARAASYPERTANPALLPELFQLRLWREDLSHLRLWNLKQTRKKA